MNEKDRRYEPDESFFSEEELEMLADASGESIRAEIDEYKKKAEESPLSSSEMPDEEILRMLKSKDRSRAKAKTSEIQQADQSGGRFPHKRCRRGGNRSRNFRSLSRQSFQHF